MTSLAALMSPPTGNSYYTQHATAPHSMGDVRSLVIAICRGNFSLIHILDKLCHGRPEATDLIAAHVGELVAGVLRNSTCPLNAKLGLLNIFGAVCKRSGKSLIPYLPDFVNLAILSTYSAANGGGFVSVIEFLHSSLDLVHNILVQAILTQQNGDHSNSNSHATHNSSSQSHAGSSETDDEPARPAIDETDVNNIITIWLKLASLPSNNSGELLPLAAQVLGAMSRCRGDEMILRKVTNMLVGGLRLFSAYSGVIPLSELDLISNDWPSIIRPHLPVIFDFCRTQGAGEDENQGWWPGWDTFRHIESNCLLTLDKKTVRSQSYAVQSFSAYNFQQQAFNDSNVQNRQPVTTSSTNSSQEEQEEDCSSLTASMVQAGHDPILQFARRHHDKIAAFISRTSTDQTAPRLVVPLPSRINLVLPSDFFDGIDGDDSPVVPRRLSVGAISYALCTPGRSRRSSSALEKSRQPQVELMFTCASGTHCCHRMIIQLTGKGRRTKLQMWIQLCFLRLQADSVEALPSTAPQLQTLRDVWEKAVRRFNPRKNPSFVQVVLASFPSEQQQTKLLSELEELGFLKLFSTSEISHSGLPYCKSCSCPGLEFDEDEQCDTMPHLSSSTATLPRRILSWLKKKRLDYRKNTPDDNEDEDYAEETAKSYAQKEFQSQQPPRCALPQSSSFFPVDRLHPVLLSRPPAQSISHNDVHNQGWSEANGCNEASNVTNARQSTRLYAAAELFALPYQSPPTRGSFTTSGAGGGPFLIVSDSDNGGSDDESFIECRL